MLKLLMTLCGFRRLGVEKSDLTWTIPPNLTSTKLEELQATIERYVDTIWTEASGIEPEDLLRPVKTSTAHADGDEPRRDAFIDDSEGSDDVQEFMFPDNLRSKFGASDHLKKKHHKRKLTRKKNAQPLADEELEDRRKAREQAALDRRRKIKSELYIRDSDEEMDEDENRAFFAREEENRKRQEQRVLTALRLGRTEETTTRKRRPEDGGKVNEKRRKRGESEDERTHENDMEMMVPELDSSPQRAASSDDELDIEDTPISSQTQASEADVGKQAALQELTQSRVNHSASSKREEAGDSDDGLAVSAPQKRRVRAGFILDDSDEE